MNVNVGADGKIDIFHFSDGWIRRLPVDAKEIVNLRHGTPIPTEEEFRAVPASKRAKPWPEAVQAPPWLPFAAAGVPTPSAPQPASAATDPPRGAPNEPPASDDLDDDET